MMRAHRLMLAALLIAMSGCSGGGDEQKGGDAAWKAETGVLDKARQVERTIQQDAERQRSAIEQQSQ